MGRAAVITKQRVLDTAKLGIERTNDCIRDVAELQKLHNLFVRKVETDLAEVRQIATSASAWAEANETTLSNVRKRFEAQLTSIQQHCVFDREWLGDIERCLPPTGFWARVHWLFFGSASPRPSIIVDDGTVVDEATLAEMKADDVRRAVGLQAKDARHAKRSVD